MARVGSLFTGRVAVAEESPLTTRVRGVSPFQPMPQAPPTHTPGAENHPRDGDGLDALEGALESRWKRGGRWNRAARSPDQTASAARAGTAAAGASDPPRVRRRVTHRAAPGGRSPPAPSRDYSSSGARHCAECDEDATLRAVKCTSSQRPRTAVLREGRPCIRQHLCIAVAFGQVVRSCVRSGRTST